MIEFGVLGFGVSIYWMRRPGPPPRLIYTPHHTIDQRALGFSMRVERVGVDKVKGRLAALKQQEEAQKNAVRF